MCNWRQPTEFEAENILYGLEMAFLAAPRDVTIIGIGAGTGRVAVGLASFHERVMPREGGVGAGSGKGSIAWNRFELGRPGARSPSHDAGQSSAP
jgi:hypothetical protein